MDLNLQTFENQKRKRKQPLVFFWFYLTVFCPNPGTITNGKIFKKEPNNIRFNFPQYITTIKHGQRLEFQCDPGYEISGASGATCINGQWVPPLGDAGSHCKPQQYLPIPRLWTPRPNRNFYEEWKQRLNTTIQITGFFKCSAFTRRVLKTWTHLLTNIDVGRFYLYSSCH